MSFWLLYLSLSQPWQLSLCGIFIDSHLAEGLRGEEIAQEIFKQGFESTYLATGSSPSEFGSMPWLKGITDKMPPFLDLKIKK